MYILYIEYTHVGTISGEITLIFSGDLFNLLQSVTSRSSKYVALNVKFDFSSCKYLVCGIIACCNFNKLPYK